MTPERWRQIEDIFNAAREHDPASRAQFLQRACAGDEDLRREIESLLRQHESAENIRISGREAPPIHAAGRTVFEPGMCIGPYRLEDALGSGGMGDVYRAYDERLHRRVAIKILRDWSDDTEANRRLLNEARAASALNHPNIVQVYDVLSAEGLGFLVMEYVDGRTLAELIGHKGLRTRDLLCYAVQIAEAVATAHERGIVHRDLKPGNVMVTESGTVKVLDFGLAKTIVRERGEDSPTATLSQESQDGVIKGTAAYMSPEQAEGRRVDRRSDIFSFGAMLYELVSGRRAFSGQTSIAVLTAVLQSEPAPLRQVVPSTPPDLEKLVSRCLRKDVGRRVQHMGDVKLALEDLREELDKPAAPQQTHAVLRLAIMAAIVIPLIGVAIWQFRGRSRLPGPILARLTSDSGLTTTPFLSPDGKLVAYASDRGGDGNLDIFVRQVGGGEPIRLTRDPADDHEPAFSADGTQIAFRSERDGGGIYLVSTLGGPARKLVDGGRRPRFSPDGKWIAYWVGNVNGADFSIRNRCRVYVMPANGGESIRMQPDFAAAAFPVWSPDATRLLFLGNRDNTLLPEDSVDWWVTPLRPGPAVRTEAFASTRQKQLTGPLQVFPWALSGPIWSQRDTLIFSAQSGDSTNLWQMRLDPATAKTRGEPERLTSGPTLEVDPSISTAPDGTQRVAFASITENVDIWDLPVESNEGRVTGQPKQLTDSAAADFHPALSPDGASMAFVSARTGAQEIWLRRLQHGDDEALTSSRTSKYQPRFSPDGANVSFSSYENKKWNVYILPTSGGTPELLCDDCGQVRDWTSDGTRVLGNSVYGRVFQIDVRSRRKTDLLFHPWLWLGSGRFSPDGHWMTFLDGTNRRTYVTRYGDGATIAENDWIRIADGLFLDWSPDGHVLYGPATRDGFFCIWGQRLDAETKRPAGEPFPVFHAHRSRLSLSNQNDMSLAIAAHQLLFSMGERTANIWMMEWKSAKQ